MPSQSILKPPCVIMQVQLKTPEGMPSGSFGNHADRMDVYVEEFQNNWSRIMQKGNKVNKYNACKTWSI
jgi:hypothetical protein